MFEAVVRVDTFNGCCERLSVVKSGRDGRDVGVVTKVVDADDPTALDEGGGMVGIGMCFNIKILQVHKCLDDFMLTAVVHNTRLLQFTHFHFIMIHQWIFLDAKHSEMPLLQTLFFPRPQTVSMAGLARNPILGPKLLFLSIAHHTAQVAR